MKEFDSTISWFYEHAPISVKRNYYAITGAQLNDFSRIQQGRKYLHKHILANRNIRVYNLDACPISAPCGVKNGAFARWLQQQGITQNDCWTTTREAFERDVFASEIGAHEAVLNYWKAQESARRYEETAQAVCRAQKPDLPTPMMSLTAQAEVRRITEDLKTQYDNEDRRKLLLLLP